MEAGGWKDIKSLLPYVKLVDRRKDKLAEDVDKYMNSHARQVQRGVSSVYVLLVLHMRQKSKLRKGIAASTKGSKFIKEKAKTKANIKKSINIFEIIWLEMLRENKKDDKRKS